ncbi:hypothetical protein F5B20DRAFT_498057 [Whalleya microplaca]|nr:hypothetical protein F5B20DRAFT_498057 [Whalleya microplaca]
MHYYACLASNASIEESSTPSSPRTPQLLRSTHSLGEPGLVWLGLVLVSFGIWSPDIGSPRGHSRLPWHGLSLWFGWTVIGSRFSWPGSLTLGFMLWSTLRSGPAFQLVLTYGLHLLLLLLLICIFCFLFVFRYGMGMPLRCTAFLYFPMVHV